MDNDSGNILAVRCQSASAPATVERVPAKHFHWTEEALDGGKPGGFETWIGQQREKAMPADRQLIRLHLTGSVSLNRRSVINDALERLGASLRHLETDFDSLVLRVEDDDLASLSSEHGFADLAARLTAEMAKDQPEAAVAKRALALLLDLARAAEAA